MRSIFSKLAGCAAAAIGWLGGTWLWDNYLKDKANELKLRLEQKKES